MASKIFKLSRGINEQFIVFLRNNLHECVGTLEDGGIIAFPTETLYGLGVDVNNNEAISRLIELKKRPKDMPVAVGVANLQQAETVAEISSFAKELLENCLPKPITILLPVRPNISKKLTGSSNLIGLRFPDEPVTNAILEEFGPITATSANIHGGLEPVMIDSVYNEFGSKIDIYIDTGPCQLGQPSTVIDTTGDTIKIIRDGACSGDELKECMRGS